MCKITLPWVFTLLVLLSFAVTIYENLSIVSIISSSLSIPPEVFAIFTINFAVILLKQSKDKKNFVSTRDWSLTGIVAGYIGIILSSSSVKGWEILIPFLISFIATAFAIRFNWQNKLNLLSS